MDANGSYVDDLFVFNSAKGKIHITSYNGSATLQTSQHGLDAFRFSASVSPSEVAIDNFNMVGIYDPANPPSQSPNDSGGVQFGGAGTPLSGRKTVNNCYIGGFDKCIWIGGQWPGQSHQNVFMSDVYGEKWHDYGVFGGFSGNVGFAGVALRQPDNTKNSGGQNQSPYYADQGPVRLSEQDGPITYNLVDMVSRTDWAAGSPDTNRTMQQCLRNNGGRNGIDQELNIARMRSQGGQLKVHVETAGNSIGERTKTVVDKVHHTITDHSSPGVEMDRGGSTFRNIISVCPNNAPGRIGGMTRHYEMSAAPRSTAESLASRMEYYNYTHVDLRSNANAQSRTGNAKKYDTGVGSFSDRYIANGIEYVPNQTPSLTGDLPLNQTPQWAADYTGERWKTNPVDTTRGHGSEVSATYRPEPGSAAIGSATGKQAIDDFYGTLRSKNTRGAVEN